jgi:DNA-binding CsgD family transcriptional regulator
MRIDRYCEVAESPDLVSYRRALVAAAQSMDFGRVVAIHFAFGVGSDALRLPGDPQRLARAMGDLVLLATHAHAAAERLLRPDPARVDCIPMSRREQEVMQWTRAGKTAWETGVILGISERTVVHHIGQAMRKLGSINKHQAVLKALSLGWIR